MRSLLNVTGLEKHGILTLCQGLLLGNKSVAEDPAFLKNRRIGLIVSCSERPGLVPGPTLVHLVLPKIRKLLFKACECVIQYHYWYADLPFQRALKIGLQGLSHMCTVHHVDAIQSCLSDTAFVTPSFSTWLKGGDAPSHVQDKRMSWSGIVSLM